MDKIKEAIVSLENFPKRNAPIDDETWQSKGVRKIVVKNFLIYYWVDDENHKVQVITVIYHRRDQIGQLLNMEFE